MASWRLPCLFLSEGVEHAVGLRNGRQAQHGRGRRTQKRPLNDTVRFLSAGACRFCGKGTGSGSRLCRKACAAQDMGQRPHDGGAGEPQRVTAAGVFLQVPASSDLYLFRAQAGRWTAAHAPERHLCAAGRLRQKPVPAAACRRACRFRRPCPQAETDRAGRPD